MSSQQKAIIFVLVCLSLVVTVVALVKAGG